MAKLRKDLYSQRVAFRRLLLLLQEKGILDVADKRVLTDILDRKPGN